MFGDRRARCPKCGGGIARGPQGWARGKLLASFRLRCSSCGQAFRRRTRWKRAAAWVLLAAAGVVLMAMGTRPAKPSAHGMLPLLLLGTGLAVLFIAWRGILRSSELEAVGPSDAESLKSLVLRLCGIAAFAVLFGVLTDHWTHVLISLVVGVGVWFAYWAFATPPDTRSGPG